MLREPLLLPRGGGGADAAGEGWLVTGQHDVVDGASGLRRGSVVYEEEAAEAGRAARRRARRSSGAGSHAGGEAGADVDTWRVCVFNLAKVVLGAGMMAMPRTFYLMGAIPGTLFFFAIGWLTYFTLANGLVAPSDELGGVRSYAALVERALGRRAERVLQISIFSTCWAMQVVMLVMAGDILVGEPPTHGLIYQITGLESWPFASRPAVLGALAALVLVPLGSMRSMDALASVNIVGVGSNALMAALCMALAAGAAARGVATPPPLWPQWGALVSAAGGRVGAGLALSSTLPVILNCFSCHQGLHPLLPCLRPYSTERAQSMVGAALTVAGFLNYTVAICAVAAFGPLLRDDLLSNVTAEGMAPLLGSPALAAAASLAVRLGFLLSLLGSFLLLLFPLRHVLADVLLGGHDALTSRWVPVTAAVTGAAYLTATLLSSIYATLSLVGATATTVLSWVLPALLVMALEKRNGTSAGGGAKFESEGLSEAAAAAEAAEGGGAKPAREEGARRGRGGRDRGVAVVILVIGVAMFVQAIVGAVFDRLRPAAAA